MYHQNLDAVFCGGKTGDPDVKKIFVKLSPLEGMLSHVYQVRNKIDLRPSADKKRYPTATRRLYHSFLFYKNFVCLDMPLLLPEGKTDSIYLKLALERLSASYPSLVSIHKGKITRYIKFMQYGSAAHDILQLGGGTGDLKFFILRYHDIIKKFKHLPLAHPVIILIDNDKGADEIFSVLKGKGITISHSSTDEFYRVVANLYIVKTPESEKKGNVSCIEDLFDPTLLSVEIDGKQFDPNKQHNESGKYGKSQFAEKVIKPDATKIDFFEVCCCPG